MLAVTAAKALVGETTSGEVVRAAAEAVVRDIDPTSDIHASAEYRRQLARVLTRRAVTTAFARCS
jgi:CO/xanthine dehydrogenase FAD-binding subunit